MEGISAIAQLTLRGKDIHELRMLAHTYLDLPADEIDGLDRNNLISLVSKESRHIPELGQKLASSTLAFKPSFYVMVLTPKDSKRPTTASATPLLRQAFFEREEQVAKGPSNPPYKGFRVEQMVEHDRDRVEIHFTWEKIHWYWKPIEVSKAHVYELQFGLAILDFTSRKAIVACHNESERNTITEAIASVYPVSFSPLTLTKAVLDQIGKFDNVRRASYFIGDPDSSTPANISYADDQLPVRSIVRAEEDDPRSQRKQTFYLIPLGSIEEQGVGATSDTGKLWISREVPIDSVREYGLALLERIGNTLDVMTERGEYSKVFASLGVHRLPGMSAIRTRRLRNEIAHLTEQLVNMLLGGEGSRPFTVTETLTIQGVPSLFNYPRLLLVDSDTGDVAFWSNSERTTQMVRVISAAGKLSLKSVLTSEEINLSQLHHPITNSNVEILHPLRSLNLVPTLILHEILIEAVEYVSQQFDTLRKVTSLPFQIRGNQILLDLERAFGRARAATIGTELSFRDIQQLQVPTRQPVPSAEHPRVKETLRALGEKCADMSDENCKTCIDDEEFLCLRALVARYLRNPLLLAHKGIELSDVQGSAQAADEELSIFGFAKLASGKKASLTARNQNGAILLSQVLGQVDKGTFNTVAIISPSSINEDLRERLKMVCGVFNKYLLILDSDVLGRLLLHFEEQAKFDDIDVELMYTRSGRK